MTPADLSERRRYPRRAMSAGLRFLHVPTGRSFPARSANFSRGGMMMYVPAAAPIRPGQALSLPSLPGDGPAPPSGAPGGPEPDSTRFAPPAGRPVRAVVVRVNRGEMLARGCLTVGVEFLPSAG